MLTGIMIRGARILPPGSAQSSPLNTRTAPRPNPSPAALFAGNLSRMKAALLAVGLNKLARRAPQYPALAHLPSGSLKGGMSLAPNTRPINSRILYSSIVVGSTATSLE